MKAVILNYTGGRANWGCQATSVMLAEFLAQSLAGVVTQIDTIPLPPPHFTDNTLRKRQGAWLASIYADPTPQKADLAKLERLARRRFAHLYKRMIDADLVFFQGEGTISDAAFFSDTRLFALPLLAAKWHHKKLFALNQSISLAHPGSAGIVKSVLGHATLNVFREPYSADIATKLALPRVMMCPDMAFRIKSAGPQLYPAAIPTTFCVTGSAILDDAYMDQYGKLIADIARRTGLVPVFLAATGHDRELYVRYRTSEKSPASCVTSQTSPTQEDILPHLSQAAFTIGGRYHTSIMSAALGTPVVLLESNSSKSIGLSQMLFGENRVRKPAEGDAIFSDVNHILTEGSQSRQELLSAIRGFEPDFVRLRHQLVAEVELKGPVAAGVRSRIARTPFNGRSRKFLTFSTSKFSLSDNLRRYDCDWQSPSSASQARVFSEP
jgi:polysaccharide pyruvyl transferase WcaK-like protein